MMTGKIFVGKEVEGPERGEMTIFIPRGAVTANNIKKVYDYAQENDIRRWYFGAGEWRGLSSFDIILIGRLKHTDKIYAEITPSHLKDIKKLGWETSIKIQFVLTIVDTNGVQVEHLKIDNKREVFWWKLGKPDTNKTNDKLYTQDKILEL